MTYFIIKHRSGHRSDLSLDKLINSHLFKLILTQIKCINNSVWWSFLEVNKLGNDSD